MDFEKIYRDYFKDVFLYIRKISGDESLAEEITSETFFKALKSIDSFRGDSDIRVWLCQIGKNTYFSHLKKQGRIIDMESIAEIDFIEEKSMETDFLNKADTMKINQYLHNLSNPYKEVFMWRVYGELSFKEIGRLFNKTDNWACVTYHRAKNTIKERMEKDEKRL